MAPNKYNDSRLIRRIAQESGLSVSSIYSILNGEVGFSDTRRRTVEELARTYGLTVNRLSTPGADITLGVIVPKSPSYFWNEAMAGMKKAVTAYQERGIRVKAIFRSSSLDFSEDMDERLAEGVEDAPCDAYILYPLLPTRLWKVLSELPTDIPLVLFNNRPRREEQKQFFETREACAYIGADNVAEGQQAAMVIQPYLKDMHHLTALAIGAEHRLVTGLARIEGFTAAAREMQPDLSIETLPFEVTSRTSASLLAGELEHRLLEHRLDGIYVSEGFAYIAASAIRKICRKHGVPELSIPCIGHEFSPSDKPYLLDGILRGYVRQDVYRQGQLAVETAVENLVNQTPMQDVYLRSSVFIR